MSRFVLRKNQRFRVSLPVLYHGKEVAGEGMVIDLSLSGWRIRGNEAVFAGMALLLRVYLPTEPEPLRIDGAIVQWVKGLEFGVQFETSSQKTQDRIEQIIAACVQKPHGPGPASASPTKKTDKVS